MEKRHTLIRFCLIMVFIVLFNVGNKSVAETLTLNVKASSTQEGTRSGSITWATADNSNSEMNIFHLKKYGLYTFDLTNIKSKVTEGYRIIGADFRFTARTYDGSPLMALYNAGIDRPTTSVLVDNNLCATAKLYVKTKKIADASSSFLDDYLCRMTLLPSLCSTIGTSTNDKLYLILCNNVDCNFYTLGCNVTSADYSGIQTTMGVTGAEISDFLPQLVITLERQEMSVQPVFPDDLKDKPVNVYSIPGYLIKANVKANEAFNGLSKGIYVVNGKKIIIK